MRRLASIRAANDSSGSDLVVLPAGTFVLSLDGPDENQAAAGDLDITDALTIRGAGAGQTTVDGSGLEDQGMFDVRLSGGGEAAFEDVTLTGASFSGEAAVIDADTASLVLRRTVITENVGEQIVDATREEGDGAVLIEGSSITQNRADDEILDADPDEAGSLTIRDSTISDNTVGSDEAVIDQNPSSDAGTLTIERSRFERNVTTGGKGEEGNDGLLLDFNPSGGGELEATVRISDSRFADNLMAVLDLDPSASDLSFDGLIERTTFADNVSDFDGAAILFDPSGETGTGNLLIRDSTFSGNEIRGGFGTGGAIYSTPSLTFATLDVAGSTFSGNEAAYGGAIAVDDGDMTVENSTFSGNEVAAGEGDALGGAIASFDSRVSVELAHVTIAGNRVIGEGEGGGIHTEAGFQDQQTRLGEGVRVQRLEVVNSIVAGNTVGDALEDCSEPVLSEGSNIESATSCGFEGEGDAQDTDPRLAALAANGGATETRAIGKDSPAFDAADSEFCPAADQRGVTRPQFAGCDIGAFELAPPPPPQPDPVPQPAAPAAPQGAVLGTTERKCASRRRFSIKLRVPRGERVVKAVVRVNGKRVLVRRGKRLTSTVNLRGLPRGRFRVQIKLTLASGESITGTRRYRTCTKASNDGVPPRV